VLWAISESILISKSEISLLRGSGNVSRGTDSQRREEKRRGQREK
jgi:hypothetical protein